MQFSTVQFSTMHSFKKFQKNVDFLLKRVQIFSNSSTKNVIMNQCSLKIVFYFLKDHFLCSKKQNAKTLKMSSVKIRLSHGPPYAIIISNKGRVRILMIYTENKCNVKAKYTIKIHACWIISVATANRNYHYYTNVTNKLWYHLSITSIRMFWKQWVDYIQK